MTVRIVVEPRLLRRAVWHGAVGEELVAEVMAELPTAGAPHKRLGLVGWVRTGPPAWPDARDSGSVEEIREAFGARCRIRWTLRAGVIEVREIGGLRR